MLIGVVSLFPKMFDALATGVVGRAFINKLVTLHLFNPIDFLNGEARVDDKPYGGGPGMVMRYEPLERTLQKAFEVIGHDAYVVYLSPQGKQQAQENIVHHSMDIKNIIFICGRYEGVDQRFIDKYVAAEWSLGDFVMTGGEYAAMAYIDALVRTLPGCVGDADSVAQDSFSDGILDYPHYTRPAVIDNLKVPSVLLEGNHNAIKLWRRQQALGITWLKRPDLIKKLKLSQEDLDLLVSFKRSYGKIEKLK
jgi:tRNA (guanine37-N1)-methyltransferase